MKHKRAILVLCFLVVIILAFVAGRIFQQTAHGHYFDVLNEESIEFRHGDLILTHAFEAEGVPFLAPETSIITFFPMIGLPVTLYKAQRGFQEASPHVANVTVDSNTLLWTDRINNYRLEVTPIKSEH
jgi:hypothetical protein